MIEQVENYKTIVRHVDGKGHILIAQSYILRDAVITRNIARMLNVSNENVGWQVRQYLFSEPEKYRKSAGENRLLLVLGEITLVNHSEKPNAFVKWPNKETEIIIAELIAVTDISDGEEITTQYVDIDVYDIENFIL